MKTVIILEDQPVVTDSLAPAITADIEDDDVDVIYSDDCEALKQRIVDEAEEREYIAAVVDQVKDGEEGIEPEDRNWGISFLRWLKEHFPNVPRILYSGQTRPKEMEEACDDALVDQFVAKHGAPDDADVGSMEKIVSTIASILRGKPIFNVRVSDHEREFDKFLAGFVRKVPGGKSASLVAFDGSKITVEEALEDPAFIGRLKEAYFTGHLAGLVAEAIKERAQAEPTGA